jgi:16S rRNA (adenine1518-N6/adenine1519-N6)-dimethyltransferase
MATLEIGAGRGALTRHLAAAAPENARVLAVEVDYDLIPGLESLAAEHPCVRPVQSDVLDIDLPALLTADDVAPPIRVVGNVPYNITTPILTWLLAHASYWDRAIVMTQKEVADRLATTPGTAGCGSISVFVHYHATVKRLFDVGVGAFTPRPRVRSSVIEITPREAPAVDVADPDLFFTVTRQAFQQRRKMLRGALRPLGADASLAVEGAGIDPTRRGETLSIEEFAAIANCLHDARTVT